MADLFKRALEALQLEERITKEKARESLLS
jgi:hypothetical protein